MSVLDDEARVLALSFAASASEGAGTITGTVSTSAVMGSNLVVSLSSDDTTEATVPTTVTILAGQSSASFTITLVDDAATDGAQTVAIGASAATFTSATRNLIVTDNDAHHFSLAPITNPQIKNAAFPITITARTIDDETVTAFTSTVNLSAADAGGAVPFTPAVSGNFVAGVWTGNVSVGAFATGVQITTTRVGGLIGVSNSFDVTSGPLDHFVWSTVTSPQYVDTPFAVTLTALDVAGNTAAGFVGVANLTSTYTGITPAVTGSFVGGVWSGNLSLSQAAASASLTATNGAATGQSNQFTISALVPLTVSLAAPSVIESGSTLSGTVAIAVARATNLTVTLDSSDVTEIAQPASMVTIPAGQTSAPFTLTVVDDSVLDGPQIVSITANAFGCETGSASVTVTDDETTTISLSLPASMTENQGTLVAGGTVTLGAAPAGPINVQLSSSDTTEIAVPVSVVVPAGQTSATFDVTLPDDIYIDGPQNVTVTAHVAGWADASANGIVQDDEGSVISVSLPFPVAENVGGIAGTVSVAGIVSSAVDVSLVSSSPADLTVPSVVTIPAGASSVGFTAQVIDDTLPETTESITVSASALSFTGGNALTFITDNDPAAFVLSAIPSSVMRNVPQAVTITATGLGGATMSSFTGSATLSAAGDGGAINLTPVVTGSFTDGVWTGNVNLLTPGTNVHLTATSGSVTGTSNAFAVTEAPLDHFTWDTIPSPRYAGVPFPVTIHARDAANNDVFGFAGPAPLSVIGGGTPVEVTIGSGTGSVGVLLHAASHDVRSQVIYTPAEVGAAGVLSSLSLNVATAPGQTLNNWTIRMKHTTRSDFSRDKLWESSSWTTVHQSNQTITTIGWVDFPFSTTFDYNGTDNLLVDFSFNNSSASSNGNVLYTSVSPQRTMYAFSNSTAGDPLTWSGFTPSASGSNTIWNVKLLREPPTTSIVPAKTGTFSSGFWSGDVMLASEVSQITLRVADGAGHTGDSSAFEVLPSALVLNAEPAYTGGTTNWISWPVKGPGIQIEVQLATNGDFSGAVSSGWVPPGFPSVPIGGLQHGTLYFYRARMRRPGVWTADWSPTVSSIQDAQPPNLSFNGDPTVFTTQTSLPLTGESWDLTSGIASVTVNGVAATTSDSFAHWSKSLPGLLAGSNTFTVTASDRAVPPNTATATYVVFRIATPAGDSDGDGINDLLGSAFNLNPAARDGSGLPVVSVQTDSGNGQNYLTLQFRRRIQPGGLRYIVETSNSLSSPSWTSTGGDTQELSATPTGDGVTVNVIVRVTPATGSVLRKFVRLRVEVD